MIETREVVIRRVVGALGGEVRDNAGVASPETIAATGFDRHRTVSSGARLRDVMFSVARKCTEGLAPDALGGVIVASFSHENRFPPLAVELAGALDLSHSTMAVDLQLACAAYPYALYFASRAAADTGRPVLVVDGDVQSRLVDGSDRATAPLFSDAATATLVEAGEGVSRFDFLTHRSDALSCGANGPIAMNGFKVFSFVATEVVKFLKPFGGDFDAFVPHQANMYMVRQLAKSLGLEDRLVTCGADFANPGSASVPLALARFGRCGERALVAAFGAGFAASAATVRLAEGFAGEIIARLI